MKPTRLVFLLLDQAAITAFKKDQTDILKLNKEYTANKMLKMEFTKIPPEEDTEAFECIDRRFEAAIEQEQFERRYFICYDMTNRSIPEPAITALIGKIREVGNNYTYVNMRTRDMRALWEYLPKPDNNQQSQPQENAMQKPLTRQHVAQLLAQTVAILTTAPETTSIHNPEAVLRELTYVKDNQEKHEYMANIDVRNAVIDAIGALKPNADLNELAKRQLAEQLEVIIKELRLTPAPEKETELPPLKKKMVDSVTDAIEYIMNGKEMSATQLAHDLEIVKGFLMSHEAVLAETTHAKSTENVVDNARKTDRDIGELFSRAVAALALEHELKDEDRQKLIDDLLNTDQFMGQYKRERELKEIVEENFDGLASIMRGGMQHIDNLLTQVNQLRRDLDMGKASKFRPVDTAPSFDSPKNSQAFGRSGRPFGQMVNPHWQNPGASNFQRPFPGADLPFGYRNMGQPESQQSFGYQPYGAPSPFGFHNSVLWNYDGIIMVHIPDVTTDFEAQKRGSLFTEAFPNAKFYVLRYPEYTPQKVNNIIANGIELATDQHGTTKIYHFVTGVDGSGEVVAGICTRLTQLLSPHSVFKIDAISDTEELFGHVGAQLYHYALMSAALPAAR